MVGKYVSQHYQDFVDLCGKAYVSVRRHSGLLIALFELMVSGHMRVHTSSTVSTELAMSKLPGLLSFSSRQVGSGIPQLQCIDDVRWLRDRFVGMPRCRHESFWFLQCWYGCNRNWYADCFLKRHQLGVATK